MPHTTTDRVDTRVVLAGLWTATLFVFAYVDIFGFWRADVLAGATAGVVPGVGFTIDQTFLGLTTVYVLIPSLMVPFSLLARGRVLRATSVVVALLYAVSVAATMIGETWLYYLLGSTVEIALLLTVAAVAWRRRG